MQFLFLRAASLGRLAACQVAMRSVVSGNHGVQASIRPRKKVLGTYLTPLDRSRLDICVCLKRLLPTSVTSAL
ncbi:hypothetical protein B0H63DRAFT_488707 [Podospora didyma]|uniref:Uncharacterized protein n=1 Tax=Podospora didyma TaxID=330526 RepID=A0AAE0N3Z2_9PEZI|nr:hypothetical protein B0H63DRAFT_488707 [Podospora didyma]